MDEKQQKKVLVEELAPERATINKDRLEKLGLKSAAQKVETGQVKLEATKEFKKKCTAAYEHFRYVRPEKIDSFNEALKKKTFKKNGWKEAYDQLVFIELSQYPEVPPAEILEKLEAAQEKGCFDSFEVAKIEEISVDKTPRVDPILFGRIHGCPDRFFIGQWDHDVKIEDILTEDEG